MNLQSKFNYIWKVAGPEICRQHKMKYVKLKHFNYDDAKMKTRPIHFIFLLDESESMVRLRWKNLIEALSVFIQKRISFMKDKNAREKDLVSIIGFDSTAKIYV